MKACVLGLLLIAGCDYGRLSRPSDWQELKAPRYALQITGAISTEEVSLIEKALSYLALPVERSIGEIQITEDKEHIQKDNKKAIGHFCSALQKKVCVLKGEVTFGLIWHEAAHAYVANLCDLYPTYEAFHFVQVWEKLAGDVYGELFTEAYSEGILSSYSRKTPGEDIAEWVRECLTYLYLDDQRPCFRYSPYLKTDRRYRQKFALLVKYGFFTECQYKKLQPLFE